MKKLMRIFSILAASTLALVIFSTPVSAQDQTVTMQGSGHVLFQTSETIFSDSIFTVHIDTAKDTVKMQVIFRGPIAPTPDGQFLTGLYWEGEITGYTIDGDTVTVDCLVTAYLLPWHELFPGTGPYEVYVQGKLTGQGRRGEITVGSLNIPGTIIIR